MTSTGYIIYGKKAVMESDVFGIHVKWPEVVFENK